MFTILLFFIYVNVVLGASTPLLDCNDNRFYDFGGKGNKLSIFRLDHQVWVYYGSWSQPACIAKFWNDGRSISTEVGNAMLHSGDAFDSKICIKPDCSIMFKAPNPNYKMNNENRGYCCKTKIHHLLEKKCNVDASCNDEGCVTKYGYVPNSCIE